MKKRGRPKSVTLNLPVGVQCVRKTNGRKYYYYRPEHGTENAPKAIALGKDILDPGFWQKLRQAQNADPLIPDSSGTFGELIAEYRGSHAWDWLTPRTQRDYASYLDKISTVAGDRLVKQLTRADIYKFQNDMSETPVAANHMISVLKMLLEWSVKHGYRADNPALGIEKLKSDSSGARPWPDYAFDFVMKHAPVDLMRMAYLGRACGQRREDLVALRGANLKQDGIKLAISKLRGKIHFVPLEKQQIAEIRRWNVADLEYFLLSPTHKPYTGDGLNSRWNRWLASEQAEPVRGEKLTIHGLRATAVCDRRQEGSEDGAIAAEIGMSVPMVSRYARFADQMKSARASRDRREQRKRQKQEA